jgi:hypothetical protein
LLPQAFNHPTEGLSGRALARRALTQTGHSFPANTHVGEPVQIGEFTLQAMLFSKTDRRLLPLAPKTIFSAVRPERH